MIRLILKIALIILVGNAIGGIRKADRGKKMYEIYSDNYKNHIHNKLKK